MNAFPPPHLVRTRIYRWVRDPIYIGFVLACAGVSIASGSPAGLWIVTPVTALASAALVYGYERHDLRRRFGQDALPPVVLSIPPGDDNAATAAHRAAVFLWVLIPWLVIFYAVQALGRQADAFGTMLPFESGWTVLQWTELGYVSAYLFIPLTGTADPNAARSPPLRGIRPDRDCRGLDRVADDSGSGNQPTVRPHVSARAAPRI